MPNIEPERVVPHIVTIHDLDSSSVRVADSKDSLAQLAFVEGWDLRFASRCVITQSGRIALQHLESEDAIKIPGGGMHTGETFEAAVKRELIEEVGIGDCILRSLGVVIEYRKQWSMVQISYCFEAKLDPEFEAGTATEEGSSLIWADSARDAQELISNMKQDTYDKQFMAARDLQILAFYDNI